MAEGNRKPLDESDNRRPMAYYSVDGHPTVEQLMAEQGTAPITDPASLHGDFWPEDESVEEFLAALESWRGRKRTDPAA